MAERYRGRVAVVTGGTTGIGRGVVDRLVGEGASVVTCARHAPESTLPDGATFIAADITDETSVSGVIDAAVDRHGRLDVVVANAGGANIGAWPDEPVGQWRELIDINLHGTMLTCKSAWPHLVSTQGNIVVISSLSAWMGVGAHEMEQMGGFQPSAAYQASKAGDRGARKTSRGPRRRAWAASQRGASGAHPDRQVAGFPRRGWPLLVPLSEHSVTQAPWPR
jgi:meso-butanediol dehydrogenase/(S,S)-butanediol dehydrogenase/diacetyl reductase